MLRIEMKDVCQSFGSKCVFKDFSASFSSGTITSLTGMNGAGKSTLLRLAGKLIFPETGEIIIREDDQVLAADEYRARIGMISPDLFFYTKLTAGENLRFFTQLRGLDLTMQEGKNFLQQVGLAAAGGLLETFSTGMRQRLKLAVLLAVQADVWLLDEPGSNLDASGRELTIHMAREAASQGKLILWATNDPQEVEAADAKIHLS